MHTTVGDSRPGDVLLLAYLSAHQRTAHDAHDGHQGEDAVQQARVAYFLGYLAGRVARYEVGDYADRAVVETSEHTVLKFAGHDLVAHEV